MGMIPVKCPECGADIELDDSREFGFCNYCGTKVMQDKVVVEHQGTVQVDVTNELNNLYVLARRAKNDGNAEKAEMYYDQILLHDTESWEANFYSVYYQALNCKIAEIRTAATKVSGSIRTVMGLIESNLEGEDRDAAIDEVTRKYLSIASMLANGARSHYNGIDAQIRSQFTQEYLDRANCSTNICYILGNYIESNFEEHKETAIDCWKKGVALNKQYVSTSLLQKKYYQSVIDGYVSKIQKADPSYQPPSGGCYVATAVYGSYDCPEVWTLRRYRDNQLAKTWYGRLFIRTYYAISPTLVKWFGDTQWFKNMWKPKLDSMVKELQESGVESTPYEDRKW